MERREFVSKVLAGGMLVGGARLGQAQLFKDSAQTAKVVIERDQPGKPHAGKVLAAIQPHSDDIPLFCAGTVAKLIKEGYSGILIRTSNSEMAGRPPTRGEVILGNEKENAELARVLGLTKVFNFFYRNHMMDGISPIELRERLIFVFRLMKVDTVISYDPWGHYEENPDHYITAQAVEAACWMAGGRWDYPEHFDAGLKPHSVREKYYFARGPQLVNRVVDVTPYVDKLIDANLVNATQGPAGTRGSELRARLAKRGLKLPLLGDNDDTANREYIRHFILRTHRVVGSKYGLEYAEEYHYIGREDSYLEDYIKKNAVPL